MSKRCVVGVDLGGTNVRARAYAEDGEPAGDKFEAPSRALEGAEATVQAVAKVARLAATSSHTPPVALGVAVPGHVESRTGVVRWAPNLGRFESGVFRHWEGVAFGPMLAEKLDLPVRLGNDANLAAFGEYRFGTGRNSARCLVLLTVGTGIGGGVVFGPEALEGDARGPLLLVGGNQGGAELGHTVIQHGGLDCNAGTYGAIEAYCQRDSIVRRALHRLQRGRKSKVLELVLGDVSKVTPRILAEAADAGDELAIEVWAEVGEYLGVGIGNFINVFAPDVVAVGGKIALAGEHLLGPARRLARNVAIPSLFADASIVRAELIDEAGTLGAAALALRFLGT